ncbi:unnamed protein product [Didymodactylos carnosus]|uniref:eIF3a PCI domain-containing protein n=1 Tax=Didymodactylos carnosus TaxID=1234261 RepID=A0A814DCC0_9BILA|nr:unnamed protein product [Didymodactylos carnosus]CAF3728120.1 unnamed protein product [Didymodactylos carnosus]
MSFTTDDSLMTLLRTTIIIQGRKCGLDDIHIDAVEKIADTTINFLKNILEQLANDCSKTSTLPLSSFDLQNVLRLNPHIVPCRSLYFSLMETINHSLEHETSLDNNIKLFQFSQQYRMVFVKLERALKRADEDVIMSFLKYGEQKCIAARQTEQNAIVDIDDVKKLQTPESLLLGIVSGESQLNHADRDILALWLKFVCESYKRCLDLLKNNNRVEKIYQDVARSSHYSYDDQRENCETPQNRNTGDGSAKQIRNGIGEMDSKSNITTYIIKVSEFGYLSLVHNNWLLLLGGIDLNVLKNQLNLLGTISR